MIVTSSHAASTQTDEPFFAADEPGPFILYPGDDDVPFLVVCDHASNRIPKHLDRLGLDERQQADHIAYDRGSLALSLAIRQRLNCPVFAATYSRLVVDMNRAIDHPTSILAKSENTCIPGNRHLHAEDRRRRIQAIFEPYHRALTEQRQRLQDRHRNPVLISVHSFTPTYHGERRPWELGILWNHDGRLAVPLIDKLSGDGYSVGDNEPYSGRDPSGYTIPEHAERFGLAHVLIEVRDDLLEDGATTETLARQLCGHFQTLLETLDEPGIKAC